MKTTKTIETGNTVTLHYKGTLGDGSEFDSSYERGEPLTVTVGSGHLIEGFDTALGGMEEGESKTFTLSPEEAYGERDPDANTTLDKTIFPEDFGLEAGKTVPLLGPNGQPFLATITEVADETITADLNHPMAGKELTFEVEVLTIGPGTEDNETSDS
jgi:peptidylprolyl isomerase